MRHRWHKEVGLFLVKFTGNLSHYEIITAPSGLSSPPATVFIQTNYNLLEKEGWFYLPSLGQFVSPQIPLVWKNPAHAQHIPGLEGHLKPPNPQEWAAVFEKGATSGLWWWDKTCANRGAVTTNPLSP